MFSSQVNRKELSTDGRNEKKSGRSEAKYQEEAVGCLGGLGVENLEI